MATSPYTDEQRAQVLAVYAEVGPAEAERRTGVASATIRTWAHRAGIATVSPKTEHAVRAAQLRWAERREALLPRMGAVAEQALAMAELALDEGHLRNAKDAATTMAILVDKAQLLSGDATSRTESLTTGRAAEVLDELAQRREQRETQAA